jgi:hypothetical protein
VGRVSGAGLCWPDAVAEGAPLGDWSAVSPPFAGRNEARQWRPCERPTLVGAFEHFYKTNRFGHPDYGTHYVVLAYGVSLKAQQAVAIDSQHSDVQWMSEDQINSGAKVTIRGLLF